MTLLCITLRCDITLQCNTGTGHQLTIGGSLEECKLLSLWEELHSLKDCFSYYRQSIDSLEIQLEVCKSIMSVRDV